jgi:hypothetical protein
MTHDSCLYTGTGPRFFPSCGFRISYCHMVTYIESIERERSSVEKTRLITVSSPWKEHSLPSVPIPTLVYQCHQKTCGHTSVPGELEKEQLLFSCIWWQEEKEKNTFWWLATTPATAMQFKKFSFKMATYNSLNWYIPL